MKYPDEFVDKIITGDCIEVMKDIPDKSIDLVLTDPPYGIGEIRKGTMSKMRYHKTKYEGFVDSIEYVKEVCVPAIEICIKKSKAVILLPGTKCYAYYPPADSFGVFWQPASCGMQLWGSADSQPILYYGRPFDLGKRIKKCSYQVIEKPSCNEHPCSKPINIWKKIIFERSKAGDIVLDPFLGSGTTAVACRELDRHFIGIEKEPKYVEIARERLRRLDQQPRML